MKKSSLIGISVIAVFIFVLSSLVNVIGYQTVQSSKQNIMNNKNNPKELLFQTIVDIANNKEIQRIILKSHMKSGMFFKPDERSSTFNNPILTKNQLRHMYIIGLLFSKIIKKSCFYTIFQQNQLINQGIQLEISAVIEKNTIIKGEISQLSNSQCNCENENITQWNFPIICILLSPLWIVAVILAVISNYGFYFVETMGYIGMKLNCFWNIVPSND